MILGIDPGTHNVGVCLCDLDGKPIHWALLKAKTNTDIFTRLDVLSTGLLACLHEDWNDCTISACAIERPAFSGYMATRSNGHDTQLILGQAYQKMADACRMYARSKNKLLDGFVIPTDPSGASAALNCARNASKKIRNARTVSLYAGIIKENVKDYSRSVVVGGVFEGANPDVLDAFGACRAGLGLYQTARLDVLGRKP